MSHGASRKAAEPVTNETLQRLYDCNAEYVARRDASSHIAQQISLEVQRFKTPGLTSVIPDAFRYESVMEIGCATGELLAAFPDAAQGGGKVRKIGFDISPLNIAAAQARFPHIRFVAGDFSQSSETADVLILSDILEHVPDDAGFLRSAATHARLVLINLPLEVSWLNARRQYGLSDPSGHLRAYSLDTGMQLIAAAGLHVVKWRQVWSHESAYDEDRRRLRAQHLGHAYAGGLLIRTAKAGFHAAARFIRPLGRRFYPSNLFVSVVSSH